MISTADFTCKSHKDPGQVVLRQLHCSTEHPWAPAMRYVRECIGKKLKQQKHIVKNSIHLKALLETITVSRSSRLLKIDIKDFFMSGSHRHLLRRVSRCAPAGAQQSFEDLVWCILHNQFVRVPGVRECFRVARGSGMGLICSGDISDWTFFVDAEENFVLYESVRTRFGILLYLRFKDDIFIILEAEDGMVTTFLDEFRALAGDFVLKLDADSFSSVEMLDLTISKEARWLRSGVLDTAVYIKPTANGVLLSSESYHAPSVHSWPLERIKHFFKISSAIGEAKIVSRQFLSRLLKHDPSHPVRVQAESAIRGSDRQATDFVKRARPSSWLPLSFSSVWARAGFTQTMNTIHEQLTVAQQESSIMFPSVGIAWSLGGKHLYRRVQSMLRSRLFRSR